MSDHGEAVWPPGFSFLDNSEVDFKLRFGNSEVGRIRACQVPLFGIDPQVVRQEGRIFVVSGSSIGKRIATGTLYESGRSKYLITADHVIDQFTKGCMYLATSLGTPPRAMKLHYEDSDLRRNTQADVCAIRLGPDVTSQLNNPLYLTSEDVDDVVQLDPSAHYLLAGFLAINSRPSKDLTGYVPHHRGFWTLPCTESVVNASFDECLHMLVEYSDQGVTIPDQSLVEMPSSLKGLSGSCLWRVHPIEDTKPEEPCWRASVVAIENLVYDDRKVRCTRWRFVDELIQTF